MTTLAGVDGCRAGWVAASRKARARKINIRVIPDVSQLFDSDEGADVVGIDIPIGLLCTAERGGRECDRQARVLLGWPRRNSVFSAPVRPVLEAKDYPDALRLSRDSSPERIGLSRQSYAIVEKIREIDELVVSMGQERIIEVHPELAFYELNDRKAVVESKKKRPGLARRIALLEDALDVDVSAVVESNRSSKVARDDIVDALAALWTAERVESGEAIRVPEKPPTDSRGLRMEIVR